MRISDPGTRGDLEALYKGLPGTRNVMILESMGMATAVAKSWSRDRRRLADDIMGAAYLGLVKGATALCNKKASIGPEGAYEGSVEGYLFMWIRGEVQHLINMERNHTTEEIEDQLACDKLDDGELYEDILAKLTEREALIIRMVLMGMKDSEIAERYEMSRSWVQMHLASARNKIKGTIYASP